LPLGQLLGHDAFLNEVRKPGLVKILDKCRSLRGPVDLASSIDSTKSALIRGIIDVYPADAEPIVHMFDNEELLKTITGNGLDLILASLGRRVSGGGVTWKIKCILQHISLKVTVRDDIGSFDMTVTRADTTENFYAAVAQHRSLLKLGNETMLLTGSLSNYDIKNGTVIENRLRHQFRPQVAMGSDEFQIFVRKPFTTPCTTDEELAQAISALGADPDLATSGATIVLAVKSDTTLLTVTWFLLTAVFIC
jgi:hypothetical protein